MNLTNRMNLIRHTAIQLALLALTSTHSTAAPELATYQLTPGWATFGLVLPRGAATGRVQVGALPTQTDVKTTWPDGSIRFAVVTCQVTKKDSYAIVPGRLEPRRFVPVWPVTPVTSVQFVIAGRTWTATLPAGGDDVWLSGSLVQERRVTVAPSDAGRTHPFLRVIFDVRSYVDGAFLLDVTVENALDVAPADQVTYDVRITLGTATVFEKRAVNHKYLTRWRKVVTAGLKESAVTPDFRPFVQAGAFPAYLATIEESEYSVEGERFDILGFGDLHLPMNDHGGRPEIAPYPDWAARYLVHRRSSQRAYLLRHGELAGSVAIHIKEPDGVRLISINDHPNFWLDRRADEDGRAKNGLRGAGVEADIAHQPSLAYLPYLITGDRFFLDEMKYWANYCLIGTYQDSYYNRRNGSQGLLGGNEPRGIGWALRNLGDAAVYVPDNDPYRAYFTEKVETNLRWLDEHALTHQTPLGTLFTGRRPEDHDSPYTWIALWEHTFVAWAVDHLLAQGFQMGAIVRDRIVDFQLRLFTSGREGYDPRYGAPYVLAIGRKAGDGYTYFRTLGEVFRVTFIDRKEALRSFAGYYGVQARLMLMIANAQGRPGAREALDYLMSDPDMEADVDHRSGWAIR